MNKLLKIKTGTVFFNMGVSLMLHAAGFLILAYALTLSNDREMMMSPYLQFSTGNFTTEAVEEIKQNEEGPAEEVNSLAPAEPEQEKSTTYFYNISDKNIDTTGLKNIYSERTLNVKIKYPYGWTFIDQNRKKRLDGVTFWGLGKLYNPPPYIHLEVVEKYLFNHSRYKYSKEMENYTIFYNDPVELSDQYTQVIYIRTDNDEDYTLKLIMKGKEQFKSFQPVFFGMLKTFTFGE